MRSNKGYYVALCACLAILVVGGLTFGMGGRVNETKQPQQQQSQVQQEMPMKPVNVNQSPDLEESMAQRQASIANQEGMTQQNNVQEKKVPEEKSGSKETVQKPKVSTTVQQNQSEPKEQDEDGSTAATEPDFLAPLYGEIVMDYSMEHGIYDATLEQFRTNHSVSIAGEKGDEVKASEGGTVKSVTNDAEKGKTVVILHNNGWETTYSQLQDDVKVKEGDKVKKGQEIGFVGEPTKYGSALGTHLDFALAKDGQYVDPKTVLEQ